MAANPFKPTAGKMPPILIGRQGIIDDFIEGLDNGAGAPGRLMLVTGQRGYGKTVMLTELGRVAAARGWTVMSETASAGMCERLTAELAPSGLQMKDVKLGPSVDIPGLASASLGSISLASPQRDAVTLRKSIEARLKKLPKGKGILFTIDEAQAASMEDMVALATTLQHVIRDEDMRDVPDTDKHGVAFVFAALPSLMDELLNNKVLTFLRRSQQHNLGDVPLPDVREAYMEVVGEAGKSIESEVALEAAVASHGYPYMIQLVGYYMWRSADRRGSDSVEIKDVQAGADNAKLAFGEAVCAPLLDGLTAAQREFVRAVAQDDPAPTPVAQVAQRTGKSASWVSKYRASLLKERVIESQGYGLVKLATPHLAEYIRRQER